jgi:hypothetical protein
MTESDGNRDATGALVVGALEVGNLVGLLVVGASVTGETVGADVTGTGALVDATGSTVVGGTVMVGSKDDDSSVGAIVGVPRGVATGVATGDFRGDNVKNGTDCATAVVNRNADVMINFMMIMLCISCGCC